MKFFKTNLCVLSITSLLVLSPSVLASSDACNNLPGSWKGKIELYGKRGKECTWEAVATFTKQDVFLQGQVIAYNVSKPQGSGCVNGDSHTLRGTCLNGMITIDNIIPDLTKSSSLKGSIFGNSIILQQTDREDVRVVKLNKQ